MTIGCAKCHTPTMDGVELYSDLLLHDVLGPGFQGVSQGQATSGLYRTPPRTYFSTPRGGTYTQLLCKPAES